MLDMGFLPALKRIAAALPKERQTMCFSATMEASVAHLVKDYMRNPVRLAFGSTLKPSENVRMQAFEVSTDRKQQTLNRLLRERNRALPGVRAHEARHGSHLQESEPRRIFGGDDSWRSFAVAAQFGACWIPAGALPRAGGDGCGVARHSRARRRACDQFRLAGDRGEFHSPRWPDGTRREAWRGFHACSPASSDRNSFKWNERWASRWSGCARKTACRCQLPNTPGSCTNTPSSGPRVAATFWRRHKSSGSNHGSNRGSGVIRVATRGITPRRAASSPLRRDPRWFGCRAKCFRSKPTKFFIPFGNSGAGHDVVSCLFCFGD